MSGTEAAARESIKRMAADAFKGHILTPKAGGVDVQLWRCARPGTGVYGFMVVACPGALVVYGDIGEAILRPSDRDVLPWLRGAVDDPHYLLSKVQPRPAKEFYAGDALAWTLALEVETNLNGNAASLRNVSRFAAEVLTTERMGDLDAYHWHELVNEFGFDTDVHGVGLGLSSSEFWLVEALRVFVDRLNAEAAVDAVARRVHS